MKHIFSIIILLLIHCALIGQSDKRTNHPDSVIINTKESRAKPKASNLILADSSILESDFLKYPPINRILHKYLDSVDVSLISKVNLTVRKDTIEKIEIDMLNEFDSACYDFTKNVLNHYKWVERKKIKKSHPYQIDLTIISDFGEKYLFICFKEFRKNKFLNVYTLNVPL